MNRIVILSNAGSGRNQRKARVLRMLDSLHEVEHIVTRSVDEVPAAVQQAVGQQPELIVVNGGDGSVQAVLTAMHACDVQGQRLAALPAGSTNMTAHDLGCGGSMRRRLAEVLELRDRPLELWNVEPRSPIRVTNADGVARLGFFFGTGTIVRGIEFWHERMRHGAGAGEWGAGAALLRAAWGIARRQPPFADPVRVAITRDDGRTENTELMFLLATSMRRLFLGIRPFWGPESGPLAVTWVRDRPRRFVRTVPSLLQGKAADLHEADGYHGCRVAKLLLEMDEAWVIDGEVFPASPQLSVELAPPIDFVRLAGPPRASGPGRAT